MDIDDLKIMRIWSPFIKAAEKDQAVKAPSSGGEKSAEKFDRSRRMTYYEAAVLAQSLTGSEGVGFVIPEGYAVICLDNCCSEDGRLNPVARVQVWKFGSYTEISPSGKALNIIIKADLSGYSKDMFYIDNQSIEVLTPGNFVSYTGNSINPKVNWIDEGTAEIQKMYYRYTKKRKRSH